MDGDGGNRDNFNTIGDVCEVRVTSAKSSEYRRRWRNFHIKRALLRAGKYSWAAWFVYFWTSGVEMLLADMSAARFHVITFSRLRLFVFQMKKGVEGDNSGNAGSSRPLALDLQLLQRPDR